MAPQSTTRVVVYIRVSTDRQAEHGFSLDAQKDKAVAYAHLYDLEIVETVVDAGLSASTLDRAGLQRALGLLTSGAADALLVVKLDRLTRSVADLAELIEEYFAAGKWALLSVGEQIDTRSAAGRLVLNVLASVSQWEREAIGERTATVMQHKLARGEYTGGKPPYGKKLSACGRTADACAKAGGCDVAGVHGVLVDVPGELVVITEARRLRGEGAGAAQGREATRGAGARGAQRAPVRGGAGGADGGHLTCVRRRPQLSRAGLAWRRRRKPTSPPRSTSRSTT